MTNVIYLSLSENRDIVYVLPEMDDDTKNPRLQSNIGMDDDTKNLRLPSNVGVGALAFGPSPRVPP